MTIYIKSATLALSFYLFSVTCLRRIIIEDFNFEAISKRSFFFLELRYFMLFVSIMRTNIKSAKIGKCLSRIVYVTPRASYIMVDASINVVMCLCFALKTLRPSRSSRFKDQRLKILNYLCIRNNFHPTYLVGSFQLNVLLMLLNLSCCYFCLHMGHRNE